MSRPLRIVSALLLLAALGYAVLSLIARPRPATPFLESLERPIVFAHQGGDGLWPSNTIYAFERALELGADVLEMDVHSSSDGTLVVIHDDTVDRTTNGSGRVNSLTVEELQALDAGYDWSPGRKGETFPYRGLGLQIPTLAQVFDSFPKAPLNLEIKQVEPSIAELLCDRIRAYGREDSVMVGSFHDTALREFRRACPEVATSAGPGEVRLLFVLSKLFLGGLYRPAADALQVPETQGSLRVVTPGFVEAAHAKNVQVHVWTPNETEEMERLLASGVDGIISDRPDRLLRVLDRDVAVELPAGVAR
ncbi:MAG TPA: glycerophosphodiester phosphodiesterase [Trueperaceae bacterium]